MSHVVEIYNMDGVELLGKTSVEEAITMVVAKKAYIVEATDKVFRSAGGLVFEVPRKIALLKYVFAKWKYDRKGTIPYSKQGVFRRDNWTCLYCGTEVTRGTATLDHVAPKSKGHVATWKNAATACQPCNSKKGGRTPEEAGMKIAYRPFEPTFSEAWKYTHPKG